MKSLLFILIIFFFSCNNTPYKSETKCFNDYLQKTFDLKINNTPIVYILISQIGCKGCMQKYLDIINQNIDFLQTNKIILITSNNKIIPNNLKNHLKIYYDKNCDLDDIELDVINMMVIKTKNEKIYEIKEIQIADTSLLIGYLNKI